MGGGQCEFGSGATPNPSEFTFSQSMGFTVENQTNLEGTAPPQHVHVGSTSPVRVGFVEAQSYDTTQSQTFKPQAREARPNESAIAGPGAKCRTAQSSNRTIIDLTLDQDVSVKPAQDGQKSTVDAIPGRRTSHIQGWLSYNPLTGKSDSIITSLGQDMNKASAKRAREKSESGIGATACTASSNIHIPSKPTAARYLHDANEGCQTSSSPPHKQAKVNYGNREFDPQDIDFILYLSLQGIHPQAVGLELHRMNQQESAKNLNMDRRAKAMGSKVAKQLKSFQGFKGTEEDAERIVSELLISGESQGWSAGPLSRAREFCNTLAQGRTIAHDRKIRIFEARCRAELKKWNTSHKGGLKPSQNGGTDGEKMAYHALVMEATPKVVDKESMTKNLLELWEHGRIGDMAA